VSELTDIELSKLKEERSYIHEYVIEYLRSNERHVEKIKSAALKIQENNLGIKKLDKEIDEIESKISNHVA